MTLSPEDQAQALRAAALGEVSAALDALADVGVVRETHRSVLDLELRQIESLACCWATLSKWDIRYRPGATVMDALKVLPEDHRRAVEICLRYGGWLA